MVAFDNLNEYVMLYCFV